MENMSDKKGYTLSEVIREFPRTLSRGIGQVMFQDNAWTGLCFFLPEFSGEPIQREWA